MLEKHTYFTVVGIVRKVILHDGKIKYLVEVDDEEGTTNLCLLPPHRTGVTLDEVMNPGEHVQHPAELLLLIMYGIDKLNEVMACKGLDDSDLSRLKHRKKALTTFLKSIQFKEITMPPYEQHWLH